MVPIGAIAHLGQVVAPPLITLYNLFASATIVGGSARGFSSGELMAAMERIAKEVLPSDVSYEWSAMSYQEKITGNQLYYVFGLSVLLVYLCLAGQYESWILPLAVLSAVPLALVGPVLALTSLGVANNLYTQIGLMLLIALSAKNGILIVEVARERRIIDGRPLLEAAVDASRTRFRPILMTSFAFILGVLPLVTATGAGANARRSLGISVFSGMIASTCLAVLFVPSFFVVLQRFEEWRKRPRERGKSIERYWSLISTGANRIGCTIDGRVAPLDVPKIGGLPVRAALSYLVLPSLKWEAFRWARQRARYRPSGSKQTSVEMT